MSDAASRSHFADIRPEQRLLSSTALAVMSFVLWLYALSGLMFGYLPVFVLDRFLTLQGVPAVLGAVGSAALGFGWSIHLFERHWSTASAERCAALRRTAYQFSGLAWAVAACVLFVMVALDIHALGRPIGLAPRAEWMLAPLPSLWRFAVAFSRDAVEVRLFVVGTASVLGMLLFQKGLPWPRGMMACIGLLLWTVGLLFVGHGAFQYAAARGLGGLILTEVRQAWSSDPGLHNAWTWLAWWGGLCCLAAGTLVLYASLILPRETLAKIGAAQ
jgi:hypothetical protein